MSSVRPRLRPGRVYRSRDFSSWSRNPTRLAKRLVREGLLRELRHGLYAAPEQGSWGTVPPTDEELMRALLGSEEFLFTGSEFWNALGLGATAVSPERLVYNTKRSGLFELDGRRFRLRRVTAPRRPTAEWYALDLLENHGLSGVDLETLEQGLVRALRQGGLRARELREAAQQYGTRRTREQVERALRSLAEER